MTTPTLDDLMRRTLAGQSAPATPDQYDDVLKLLADAGVAPDPGEDAALKEMLEDKGSIEAGVLADSIESGSQPLGDRTSKMLKDAALRRLYESGEKPASRAYAEALPDEMPPAPPVTEPVAPEVAPAAAPAAAQDPQLKTTPEAIAEAQAKSKNAYSTLAVGQPPEGAPASASPYTGHDAAEEERRNQEARRAKRAQEIHDFLKDHPEATIDDAMGAREKKFREESGEKYGGNKWLAGLTKEGIAAYEGGSKDWADRLAKAREGDVATAKEGKPISNAMIGVIARANPALPIEEIAKLREGDPLIKLLGQGGLGQDQKLTTELLKLIGTGIETGSEERQTLTRAGATVDAANAKQKPGGGGGGAALADRQAQLLVHYMKTSHDIDITLDQARQAVQKPSSVDGLGLPAGVSTDMVRMANTYRLTPGKEVGAQMKDIGQQQNKNVNAVEQSLARWRNQPEKRAKFKIEMGEIGHDIDRARKALKSLTPEGRKMLAQVQGQGLWGNWLKKGSMSAQDQVAYSELQGLLNQFLKIRSGAAVTESEWGRMAQEAGFASNDLDLFNSPEVVDRFILNVGNKWALKKNAWESEYGPLYDKKKAP